jgi:hypothetical protein
VPKDALKITGEVKCFDLKGDSGNTLSRGFCPNCGSRLFSKLEAAPAMMGIAAASLEDGGWYKPAWTFTLPAHGRGLIWIPRCRSCSKMPRF